MKNTVLLALTLALALLLTSCAAKQPEAAATVQPQTEAAATEAPQAADDSAVQITATVTQNKKYNSATVSLSPEEFQAAGFTLGDSCDISFGNGYTLSDVPFYNGYYIKDAEPVLVAYPGFSNISITLNNMGIWEAAALTENESVTITLAEAGKYAAIQEVLGQLYSFDRNDYPSDTAFCNYRALTGGALKADFLFRGASPVDNSRGRAAYTDALLEQAGIRFVLDLADSAEDMEGYRAAEGFASPYTAALYENGQVALLGLGSAFQSQAYCGLVAAGAKQMLTAEGPVYIHCMEGKDRTGFVCILFEALAGASYEEMRADYLLTYRNYYGVSAEETPEKYEAITALYFDAYVAFLHGTEDMSVLTQADYTQDAANYLIAGGMTAEEVAALQAMITG